ncbi:hypothetical protein [Haloarcula japonica]|uniref:DUF4013 domain-containing protein n=1 Tax=Haloarcula japonica (strain ATCC 49778 / DSM 6131 / JCM 7785 / NBRC 101032 / NCIMB 13157 / TR-1) TaxID=1227453 RepID=M0L1T0_HALJT|nr:hypothetical protein [Haloarcula japonica]EMA27033.1 hypothetical protein C444_21456 [Haloarcula japonica DSM 6131]
MTNGDSADATIGVHRALATAARQVYRHPLPMVAISVGWVLASIPLITIGPATLGAYRAVRSVREDGRIDRGAVRETLAAHWLDAVLFSGLLVVFPAIAVLYLGQYAATGAPLSGVLGAVGFYLTYHAWVVFALAFVSLADGADAVDAVTGGYRWSVENPVATVLVGIVTATLLIASAVLTIALPLVFPALAAAFHTELFAENRTASDGDETEATVSPERSVSGGGRRNDFSTTFGR